MADTIAELRQEIEANGNVKTMPMAVLRDVHGAKKLGVHVRTNISKALRGAGLAHMPDPLPDYQEQLVRVYKQGTAVADLIDAAANPSAEHDDELRQVAGGDASDTLDRIRELVCR